VVLLIPGQTLAFLQAAAAAGVQKFVSSEAAVRTEPACLCTITHTALCCKVAGTQQRYHPAGRRALGGSRQIEQQPLHQHTPAACVVDGTETFRAAALLLSSRVNVKALPRAALPARL
jgi:hypothetical protein